MKKVINIETAPGKFVPTLMDVDEIVEKVEEKPKAKKAAPKKRGPYKKKSK